ncbi:MarR family winged helix-turn-helix transcriptional regulator [Mesoplasma corruscae]|uniref:HTH marR-type domain-containing protein n=1 Tax=Mesoplasma corruscae TaxID=216874 RepID=A0A2S5RHE9_9MOLU|nr:MarR family winged helix-turn-helix transcriptional regulator [Mesoplasma corruscae]PPE06642.1 hypothetical protein MCORR_v1c02730 [Mesoplasma corruscae]
MKKKYNLNNLSVLLKGELLIMIIKRQITKIITHEYPSLYPLAYFHLMFIKNVEGISQTELAYLTDTTTPTLHRNIKTLIKEGFIVIKTSSRANENEIYLTNKGEVLVAKVCKMIDAYEDEMNLNKDNLSGINEMFVDMINKHKTK